MYNGEKKVGKFCEKSTTIYNVNERIISKFNERRQRVNNILLTTFINLALSPSREKMREIKKGAYLLFIGNVNVRYSKFIYYFIIILLSYVRIYTISFLSHHQRSMYNNNIYKYIVDVVVFFSFDYTKKAAIDTFAQSAWGRKSNRNKYSQIWIGYAFFPLFSVVIRLFVCFTRAREIWIAGWNSKSELYTQ